MYSSELFSPKLLREKLENDLEISGKTQGISSLKNVATLSWDMKVKKICFKTLKRLSIYVMNLKN